MPQARRPAAGRRPSVRARWRHSSRDLRRPKGPKVSVLAVQQFHLHGQLSDPLHGAIQFRLHRIALALLERGVDPGSLSHATARAGRSLRPTARPKLHRLASQKPQNDLTMRCQTVHRSLSGPAGKCSQRGRPRFTTSRVSARIAERRAVESMRWWLVSTENPCTIRSAKHRNSNSSRPCSINRRR